MIAGFAMVAYPAEYGKSGVMTFIVSHNGKVYQKDLGKDIAPSARNDGVRSRRRMEGSRALTLRTDARNRVVGRRGDRSC